MRKIAAICAIAMLGTYGAPVLAAPLPEAVQSVAAAMSAMGYTEVAVSLRIFGGYVLQGRKGDDFAMVALGKDGRALQRLEIFRDLDGNGVFGADELVGPSEMAPLRTGVTAALTSPATNPAGGGIVPVDETGTAQIDRPGFVQSSESLFAGSSLKFTARERLGSGGIAREEVRTETSLDTPGEGQQKAQVTQTTLVPGLKISSQSTSILQPGGAPTAFAPLSFNAPMPNADAIRADVITQSPDSVAMQGRILGSVSGAETLRAGILAAVPSAETIRARIVTPP